VLVKPGKKKMEKNILDKTSTVLSSFSSRAIWVTLVFFALLSALVALQAVFVSYNKRIDLTPTKKFSLSPQSKKILKNLDDEIFARAFYENGKYFELFDHLSKFSVESSSFKFEMVSLDSNPKMAKEYGITRYGQCILIYKDRQKRIQYPTESNVVSAIIELTSRSKRRLLFLEGHGERRIGDDVPNGLLTLANELKKENYQPETASLIRGEDLRSGVDLILLAGPEKDLFPKELKALKDYLLGGGSLLILLDPGLYPELERFLNSFCIQLKEDIIADEKNRYTGKDQFSFVIPMVKKHLITEGTKTAPVFTLARSISMTEKGCSGVDTQLLLMSSEESLSFPIKAVGKGKFELKTERKNISRGPIPVAAAAEIVSQGEGDKKRGRLVIMGDSDFINNEGIYQLGNMDLILNTIGWLVGREELIGTRQKPFSYYYPNLSPKDVRLIFWPTIVIMPALAFILGVVIFVRRRMRN